MFQVIYHYASPFCYCSSWLGSSEEENNDVVEVEIEPTRQLPLPVAVPLDMVPYLPEPSKYAKKNIHV